MKLGIGAALLSLVPALALADTTLIDTSVLTSKVVHDTADLTPLVVTEAGKPAVVLLDIADGVVVPPHKEGGSLSLITVLSGTMHWSDGTVAQSESEAAYPAGSVLAMPAGIDHWVAARDGDVRLQLVFLHDSKAVPGIQEQLK